MLIPVSQCWVWNIQMVNFVWSTLQTPPIIPLTCTWDITPQQYMQIDIISVIWSTNHLYFQVSRGHVHWSVIGKNKDCDTEEVNKPGEANVLKRIFYVVHVITLEDTQQ